MMNVLSFPVAEPIYNKQCQQSVLQKGLQRRLHSAPRLKRASFLLGVSAFRPKFYGNGVIPCQNVDTIR